MVQFLGRWNPPPPQGYGSFWTVLDSGAVRFKRGEHACCTGDLCPMSRRGRGRCDRSVRILGLDWDPIENLATRSARGCDDTKTFQALLVITDDLMVDGSGHFALLLEMASPENLSGEEIVVP